MIIVMLDIDNRIKFLAKLPPYQISHGKRGDFLIQGWDICLVPVRAIPEDEIIIFNNEDDNNSICMRFKFSKGVEITMAVPHALRYMNRIIEERWTNEDPVALELDDIFNRVVYLS